MNKDSLGDRMKGYETQTGHRLLPRTPAIIRVDGKAFHTLTRGMTKPWDQKFNESMMATMAGLCREVQGAKFAYVQSDEISILMTDYDDLTSQAWFGGKVQKIVSVAAAIASVEFSCALRQRVSGFESAVFDARVFNLPEAEVVNYFIWRQQDAARNSVQMLARHTLGHAACDKLSCDQLQEKMFHEKGVAWSALPIHLRRGATAVRRPVEEAVADGLSIQLRWQLDLEPPVFTANRSYIESSLPQEQP